MNNNIFRLKITIPPKNFKEVSEVVWYIRNRIETHEKYATELDRENYHKLKIAMSSKGFLKFHLWKNYDNNVMWTDLLCEMESRDDLIMLKLAL